MSTRCNVIVKDEDDTFYVYHHHDGYPEGVGNFLYSKIKEHLQKGRFHFAQDVVNYLLKDKDDDEFEITSGIHGDIEYLYEIDTHNKTLKCWEYDGWNNKKGTEIDLSKLVKED